MAQKRPSTLKLWGFFLFVCEELRNRGRVSSHELAAILQKRCAAMSMEEQQLRFGAADLKETFPSQATLMRYLKWIEEDFADYGVGQLIGRAGTGNRISFSAPASEQMQMVLQMGRSVFRQLEAVAGRKRTFTAALSDAANHLLLRWTPRQTSLPGQYKLQARPFHPDDVVRGLLTGDLDLAIGWAGGYHRDPPASPDIFERKLAGSQCEVCVLFNPAFEELTHRKLAYLKEHPEDPDGRHFRLPPEGLRNCHLIAPDLPQVDRLAEAFGHRNLVDGVQRVDHFTTVVNMVRANAGIGFVYGLGWYLRELEHKSRLLSARLAIPADWGVTTQMQLAAYTRKDDSSQLTQAATRIADQWVAAVEEMLIDRGASPPDGKPEWRPAGRVRTKKGDFARGKTWYFWFVTSGESGQVVVPHWVRGWIDFKAPDRDGRPCGWAYVEKSDEKFMDVLVDPTALKAGCLTMEGRKAAGGAPTAFTTVYVPIQVTRGDPDEGVCLHGIVNFTVGGRVFSSPIVLAERQLKREDCARLVRCRLIHHLFGDEAGT